MYSWGGNNYGQLGVGDNTDRYHPTEVKVRRAACCTAPCQQRRHHHTDCTVSSQSLRHVGVVSAYAGHRHCMARTDTGRVWAWGNSDDRQTGTRAATSKPAAAAPDTDMCDMSRRRSEAIAGGGHPDAHHGPHRQGRAGTLGGVWRQELFLPHAACDGTDVLKRLAATRCRCGLWVVSSFVSSSSPPPPPPPPPPLLVSSPPLLSSPLLSSPLLMFASVHSLLVTEQRKRKGKTTLR